MLNFWEVPALERWMARKQVRGTTAVAPAGTSSPYNLTASALPAGVKSLEIVNA